MHLQNRICSAKRVTADFVWRDFDIPAFFSVDNSFSWKAPALKSQRFFSRHFLHGENCIWTEILRHKFLYNSRHVADQTTGHRLFSLVWCVWCHLWDIICCQFGRWRLDQMFWALPARVPSCSVSILSRWRQRTNLGGLEQTCRNSTAALIWISRCKPAQVTILNANPFINGNPTIKHKCYQGL